jgi:hypothetical protein
MMSASMRRTVSGSGTPVITLVKLVKVRSSSASPISPTDGSSAGTSR